MNLLRLLLPVVAGCCLLGLKPLSAQAPTFMMGKQFSADQVISTKEATLNNKIHMDGGKMRLDMNEHGMNMIIIVRPEDKVMYMVMVDQKMAMKRPYDPEEMKKRVPSSAAADGTFTLVGPDVVDGVPCIKYSMTDKEGHTVFIWVNAAQQTPYKMTDSAGTFTLYWKNYKAEPQDPSLFQVPAGYQLMDIPAGMPAMPGQ